MIFPHHGLCHNKLRWGEIYFNFNISELITLLTVTLHHRIFFESSLFVSLPNIIVKQHPLYNNIQKFWYFTLSLIVFIHPFRIGECWIFIYLVRLEIFSISFSKLNSDIWFTSISCIRFISKIFLSLLPNARLCYSLWIAFYFPSKLNYYIWYRSDSSIPF